MALSKNEIARMIDLSCVQAQSSITEISEMVELAKQTNCICCFAMPAYTKQLVEMLADYPEIKVGGVVGFPSGGVTTDIKVAEAKQLVEFGVDELDMVLNLGKLRAGDFDFVARDIAAVKKVAGQIPLKVILECHWLNDEEIVKACEICVQAGAAYVKTSTGWAPTGATEQNISLMKKTVGDLAKVKAAGGVRTLETLEKLHALGAVRFGLSAKSAAGIFAELESRNG